MPVLTMPLPESDAAIAGVAPASVPSLAVPAAAPPRPDVELPAFHTRRWVNARAVGGVAALGLAAGLAGQTDALARSPAGLAAAAGVILLATPALVVGHQYLRMRAAPGALLAAVADAFTRGGVVALGVSPAVVWLSATSDLGPSVGLLALGGLGGFVLLRVLLNLVDVERLAGGSTEGAGTFALCWTSLAGLIGLRLLFFFTF